MEVVCNKHAKYFLRFLKLLPPKLASHDSTRVTIAFFAISGLDVLNRLDIIGEPLRTEIINWIYRFQIIPKTGDRKCGGFQGSSTLNVPYCDADTGNGLEEYKWGHLAMTYTAIAILAALGDDLKRIDRKAIIEGVASVQKTDGSFSASIEGIEFDMRFVYCAAAICAMLDDWGTVNKTQMASYIMKSIRYDYGVSQHYEMESHGGTTFCALAALQLSDQLHTLTPKMTEGIKRWLIFRQVDGFQGRPNKPVDTCYSFWIGAALKILNVFDLSDRERNREYVLSTQDTIVGGFSKWPGSIADPFHTYFGLCGLSFVDEPGLLPVMPSLNISMRSYERLKHIHKTWRLEKTLNDISVNIE